MISFYNFYFVYFSLQRGHCKRRVWIADISKEHANGHFSSDHIVVADNKTHLHLSSRTYSDRAIEARYTLQVAQ